MHPKINQYKPIMQRIKTLKLPHSLTIIAILCCFTIMNAQTMKEWDDVSVFQLNRETSHDLSIPFASIESAKTLDLTQSPYFLNLNGTWKFHWSGLPTGVPAGFYDKDYNDAAWDNIIVPNPWQVYAVRNGKSWDKPLYVNTSYPFAYTDTYSVMADRYSNWTYSGNMKNPVGCYRRTFTLPEGWKDRRTFIRFCGAGHAYYVWINGQFTGYAEDSYLPSEWDITDKVQEGENTVAVQCFRFSSGSFLECQDYWRLTGITRDVYLYSTPTDYIKDFFFTTTSLKAGNTAASAKLQYNITAKDLTNLTLQTTISDGVSELNQVNKELTAASGTQTINVENIEALSKRLGNGAHQTILILDALDENLKAAENFDVFRDCLENAIEPFKFVVITCRSQFFADDKSMPETSSIKMTTADKNLLKYNKIYICPFSPDDIDLYIKRKYKGKKRKKAKAIIGKCKHLMARPVLLAHIDDLLDEQESFQTEADIYEVLIEKWIQREVNHIANPDDRMNLMEKLKQFSILLAVQIYQN